MRKIAIVFVLCLFAQFINAQTRVITGTVTDAKDGTTLPGVSVKVKSTTFGGVTDIDGNFEIKVPQEGKVLVFSFIGMTEKEVAIGATNVINVALASEAEDLDEVIVVAYGTAKKESFTGSAGVVGAKDLEERTVTSVTKALEGSTTGIQVTSGSGQPGSAPKIRIRGYGSLNGDSNPLYIVDGIQYEGDISNLSPDDIASMTILKDASSTALYGARAANGVIMIATKNGKSNKGKIKMNFKAVTGVVSQGIENYETVNAKQYYELMFHSMKNSLIHSEGMSEAAAAEAASKGLAGKLKYNPFNVANDQIIDANGVLNPNAEVTAKGLDWYEPMTQNGFREDYTFSASGGGDYHDFYASTGYLKEKGYITKSDYERFNTRVKVNITPTKWLKMGTNISTTFVDRSTTGGVEGGTGYANPFYFARNMGSIYPVYQLDADNNYILDANNKKQYDLGEERPSGANPGRHVIAERDFNTRNAVENTISNRSYVTLNLLKGLSFTMNYGIDVNNYKSKKFENAIVGDGAPDGRYSETRYRRTVTNWNQLLNYNTTINENHNIEVLLGHESFDRNYTKMYGMKSKEIVNGLLEMDQFVTPTSLSGYTSDKKTEGYLSRLKYNYAHKYYFSGSYRLDASSVFHEDSRWGSFFSVGANWRISEEQFIKDIEWIDQLKFRASYGEVGNDNLNNYYISQATYSTRPNAGASGMVWSTVGNEDLQWESNNSYDVALEFDIFGGKLHGSIEYYIKTSDGLLYNMPLPLSMGLNKQPRNVASLHNQGVELALGTTLIKTEDLKWTLDLQISSVKNEINEIPDPFVNGSKRWAEGHSIYDFYLYDYYGADARTGAALYHAFKTLDNGETVRKYDENGAPVLTEDYNKALKGYTGDSSIPDFFGSISSSVTYKNFQLDVLCAYSIGGKTLDYNYASLMGEGDYGNALHVDQLDAWKKAGDTSGLPRLENGNSYLTVSQSDRFLTDASYFSVKNINLSYRLEKKYLNTVGLSGLKIFVAAENPLIFTARQGLNPQESFAGTTDNVYLPSRVFSLGLNLSF